MGKEHIDYSQESVLVVDDNSVLRNTLENLLSGLGFKTSSVSSGRDALDILRKNRYSFLLTDMKMPQMGGMELIKKVKHEFPGISIIAMTGYSEGYRYVDVINAGASDFVKKPFDVEELEAKVRRVIEERNLRLELSKLSITDSLTGLYNHRHFYTQLNTEVVRARRQGHSLALILLDLDNFKAYNDTYGHLAGDDLLKTVGQMINKSIREGVDSGYRYGGDEFAVLLIDADLDIAKVIGKRVQRALQENGKISASIGYKKFLPKMSAEELVSGADKSLYQSKNRKSTTRREAKEI